MPILSSYGVVNSLHRDDSHGNDSEHNFQGLRKGKCLIIWIDFIRDGIETGNGMPSLFHISWDPSDMLWREWWHHHVVFTLCRHFFYVTSDCFCRVVLSAFIRLLLSLYLDECLILVFVDRLLTLSRQSYNWFWKNWFHLLSYCIVAFPFNHLVIIIPIIIIIIRNALSFLEGSGGGWDV